MNPTPQLPHLTPFDALYSLPKGTADLVSTGI